MNTICILLATFQMVYTLNINASTLSKQPVKIDLMPKTRRDTTNDTEIPDSLITRKNITPNLTAMKRSNMTLATKLYKTITNPIRSLMNTPKVYNVIKNIATCVVNGAVELISYYFPAPLIPIIASAAGMMVPIEPVLMLRDKMVYTLNINASTLSKQPVKIDLMPKTRRDTTNDTEIPDSLITRKNITPNLTAMKRSNMTLATKLYKTITNPIRSLMNTPKVYNVIKNIATCVVNGAVELISYYFPAPLIPIIASAAGMMVPIEPVLMLRDKVPVTSYRRAFMTALNSFLGTFDKYKLDDFNDSYDPYMRQTFNRRMMHYNSNEKLLEETTSLPGADEKGNKGNIIYGINKLFKTLDKLRLDGSNENKPNSNWRKRDYRNIGND